MRRPGPLRAVVCIEEREGSRGGPLWFLRLECDHFAVRRRTVHEPEHAIVLATSDPESYMKRITAPKRVRCAVCGLGFK
jgi:hypothetical protein